MRRLIGLGLAALPLLVTGLPASAQDVGLYRNTETKPSVFGQFDGEQKAAARSFMYAFSARDPKFTDRITEGATWESWSGIHSSGRSGFKKIQSSAASSYRNGRLQYVDQYQDGDVIIGKRLATAERISGGVYNNAYVEITHFRDGKVERYHEYLDTDSGANAGKYNFGRINFRPQVTSTSGVPAGELKTLARDALRALASRVPDTARAYFVAEPAFVSFTGDPLRGQGALESIVERLGGIGQTQISFTSHYADGDSVISEMDVEIENSEGPINAYAT